MLISVVIPAFNAERYIEQTVNSVLAQSHSDVEVIVVDDGSTDGTQALVERIEDARVRVIVKANGGPASARNAGLRTATGFAIAFLDADDLFDRVQLEKQLHMLRATGAAAVGSPMRLISADGRRSWGVIGKQARQEDIQAARVNPATGCAMLFAAQAVAQVGEFDESLKQAEDLDFVSRVAQVGLVLLTREVLGAYRLHSQSVTATGHADQRMYGDFVRARVAARRAGEPAPDLGPFLQNYRVSATAARHHGAIAQYRSAGLAMVNGEPAAMALRMIRAFLGAPLLMTRVLSRKVVRATWRATLRQT